MPEGQGHRANFEEGKVVEKIKQNTGKTVQGEEWQNYCLIIRVHNKLFTFLSPKRRCTILKQCFPPTFNNHSSEKIFSY